MPKTNTKAKQTGWKRQFDLTNRKVQFFVVIGIFAILGGGYFTFRSFAQASWNYAGSDKNISLRNIYPESPCTLNRSADASKNNQIVINMLCPKDGQATAVTPNTYLIGGSSYRYCASIKGGGTVQLIIDDSGGFTGGSASKDFNVINNDSYNTYCTPGTPVLTRSQPYFAYVVAQTFPNPPSATWINIQNMWIEQVILGTTPPAK